MQDCPSGGSDIPSDLPSPAWVSLQGNGQQPHAGFWRVQCKGHVQAFQPGIASSTTPLSAHRLLTQHSFNTFKEIQAKAIPLPFCGPAHPRFDPTICLLQMSRIPASGTSLEGSPTPGSLVQANPNLDFQPPESSSSARVQLSPPFSQAKVKQEAPGPPGKAQNLYFTA